MIANRPSEPSFDFVPTAFALVAAIIAGVCFALVLAVQGRAAGHPPFLSAGAVSISAGMSLVGVAQFGTTRLFLWVFAAAFLLTFLLAAFV